MSSPTQRTPDQQAIDNPCAATLRASFEAVKQQRDEAIAMLADWCVRVDKCGTGWDDWDEAYKNAAYRPCGIRELLDIAIHNEGINYVR